jgi:hypothetical protein
MGQLHSTHNHDRAELEDTRHIIVDGIHQGSIPFNRESSAAPTSTTNTSSHPRLKASEFPKFSGKDGEDVDKWISKVDAIFTYSSSPDSQLLQILPLILYGKASNWFANLSDQERKNLSSWNLWKDSLKNAFHMPNHDANKR